MNKNKMSKHTFGKRGEGCEFADYLTRRIQKAKKSEKGLNSEESYK